MLAQGLAHARGLQEWPGHLRRRRARGPCAAAGLCRRTRTAWRAQAALERVFGPSRFRGGAGAGHAGDRAQRGRSCDGDGSRAGPRAPARARGRARQDGAAVRAGAGSGRGALGRCRHAPGPPDGIAAGHPRGDAGSARQHAQGLGVHVGHAGRGRRAHLVHRARRSGAGAHAACRQPVRLRVTRAALRAQAFPEALGDPTMANRWAGSARAWRRDSAVAPSS